MNKIITVCVSMSFLFFISVFPSPQFSYSQNDRSIIEEKPVKKEIKKKQRKSVGESCYQLGVRAGRCGTLSMRGFPCDPADDIFMPERCRGLAETQRGIEAGVREVW